MDLGSHLIDLTRYLIGDFSRVNGYVKNYTSPDKRTDDIAIMSVDMKNGAIGTLEASKMATGTNDELNIEIHGLKGGLSMARITLAKHSSKLPTFLPSLLLLVGLTVTPVYAIAGSNGDKIDMTINMIRTIQGMSRI